MTSAPGYRLNSPSLRFDPALPGRRSPNPYAGLRKHGPFDSSGVDLDRGKIIFVFPQIETKLARRLWDALIKGIDTYPGFSKMFRMPIPRGLIDGLPVEGCSDNVAESALAYRQEIAKWAQENSDPDPILAVVVVPKTDTFDTRTPYYEAKAAFANMGVPTQMVTSELLTNDRQLKWSAANIALASFAKLGGIPWTVEAPPGENDLVIGIGRREIGPEGQRRRSFGYAVSFVSNGLYRQTSSFTPTADTTTYRRRLRDATVTALSEDLDNPPRRIVIHLAKNTGPNEIDAVASAMQLIDNKIPVAYLRLDDSSMWNVIDRSKSSLIPEKGSVVKLGPRRALLQSDGESPLGPPDGPLLIALDRRSTVDYNDFDQLIAQVFRLAHANWRGFNARSKPATLVYGEQLAGLVGHLTDVDTWNPEHMRSDLRSRPWFL